MFHINQMTIYKYNEPDGLFGLPDGGQHERLSRVVPVRPDAEVHLARVGVLLEGLVHAYDGVGRTHLNTRPETETSLNLYYIIIVL